MVNEKFSEYTLWGVFALILIPFAGLGAYFLFHFGHATWMAHSAKRWPTTTGRITTSEVHYVGGKRRSYRPEISYAYEVGGQSYSSTQVLPPLIAAPHRQAEVEAFVAQLPKGSTVPVFYHPSDPHTALLLPAVTAANIAGLFVLLVWVLLPPGLLIVYWRRLHNE